MPERRPLADTGLQVHPVGLGTNTFGWSADEDAAHAVLHDYTRAGGNHIDTAHTYPGWAPGREGGESERAIGSWLAANPGAREGLVIATKMGMAGGRFEKGLRREQIIPWVEGSLRRLGIERIDLLYTHEDDPATPLEETLGTLDELVGQGLVGHLGASNLPPHRLEQSLRICEREGWARYRVLQPRYSLAARYDFEGPMQQLCRKEGIAVVPYPALAGGFLTGKYRPGTRPPKGVRAGNAQRLADSPRGAAILEALDEVAAAHGAPASQVAVAWLIAQPTVASALASATRPAQIEEVMPATSLALTDDQHHRLVAASGRG